MPIIDTDLGSILNDLHRNFLPLNEGQLASYIPELGKASPSQFGLAAVLVDGSRWAAGDSQHEFTIQSISKPFIYGLALEDRGRDFVRARVGVEPTGDAFNSIIELESDSHRPYNPMINSGAIAVASYIRGNTAVERLARIQDLFSRYAGRRIRVDLEVFLSEKSTGHRNRAIAHLLKHFDVIDERIDSTLDETLDLYFQQCSIAMNTEDLALMAATLANGGVQPLTGQRILSAEHVRDLLSLMFTCGMYDSAGEWAYTVGLPAKSGVSGGILAVVPGRMGVASYSPLLDSCGHSVRGFAFFREFSQRLGLSVFDVSAWR